jgi:hypothetical protein
MKRLLAALGSGAVALALFFTQAEPVDAQQWWYGAPTAPRGGPTMAQQRGRAPAPVVRRAPAPAARPAARPAPARAGGLDPATVAGALGGLGLLSLGGGLALRRRTG